MERLTDYGVPIGGNKKIYPCFSKDIIPRHNCSIFFCDKEKECEFTNIKNRMCPYLRIIDKLASYEDTGLEPEEITTEPYGCVFYCNRKCNLDGDFCAEGPGCPHEINAETAKHLLELAQAEKDGRLVVLPVKEGAKIYRVRFNFDGNCYEIIEKDFDLGLFRPEDFGRIIFRTREEAEAALKKREATNETD